MNDPKRVDLVDCLANLLHYKCYSWLRERLRLLQLVIELTSSSNLKNNVDISRVVEAAIHFDYIGVIEKHLDLYFSNELIRYLLLMQ